MLCLKRRPIFFSFRINNQQPHQLFYHPLIRPTYPILHKDHETLRPHYKRLWGFFRHPHSAPLHLQAHP